jgi:hypothetical protein
MAHKQKGNRTTAQVWWKHLRKEWRRRFWHRERQAAKKEIRTEK